MTAAISANSSYVKANFMNGFNNKRIWAILGIVNVLSVPYALICIMYFNASSVMSLALSAVALVINVLMGMVIPFMQFDYLYNKTKVDVAYALPLTRRQKFLTDFFSGFAMYIGAYLAQMLLTLIIIVVGCNTRFAEMTNYFGWRFSELSRGEFAEYILKVMVIILLMQIMLYVFSTLILGCVGAPFEAVSAIIYSNILVATTLYVIYSLCLDRLFGVDYSAQFIDFASKTSPLGGFLYLCQAYDRVSSIANWSVWYIIVTIIYFAVAYFIIVGRKAEAVGKPFVKKTFYHIILVSVMLHIGVVAYFTGNFLITFLITTFTCYMIIEIITNRGFKKIKESLIRYAAIIAGVLIVIITISKTDCFGIAYKVYDAEDIKSITLNYERLFGDYRYDTIEIKEKENIKTVLDVQQDIINDYKAEKATSDKGIFDLSFYNSSYYYDYIYYQKYATFTFNKKSGKTANRNYHLDYDNMLQLVNVELSDEYIDALIDGWKKEATFLSIHDVYNLNEKLLVQNVKPGTSAIANEFFECLKKDLKETDPNEYMRPAKTSLYRADSSHGSIVILQSYKNTLKFLQMYNINIKLEQEDYETLAKTADIYIYPIDEVNFSVESGYYSSMSNYYRDDIIYNICEYSDALGQLLSVAQAQYASDTPCYKLKAYGNVFVIPAEYNELAEEVISLQ